MFTKTLSWSFGINCCGLVTRQCVDLLSPNFACWGFVSTKYRDKTIGQKRSHHCWHTAQFFQNFRVGKWQSRYCQHRWVSFQMVLKLLLLMLLMKQVGQRTSYNYQNTRKEVATLSGNNFRMHRFKFEGVCDSCLRNLGFAECEYWNTNLHCWSSSVWTADLNLETEISEGQLLCRSQPGDECLPMTWAATAENAAITGLATVVVTP